MTVQVEDPALAAALDGGVVGHDEGVLSGLYTAALASEAPAPRVVSVPLSRCRTRSNMLPILADAGASLISCSHFASPHLQPGEAFTLRKRPFHIGLGGMMMMMTMMMMMVMMMF